MAATGAMTSDRGNGPQLGSWNVLYLIGAILRREIQIRRTRHHQRSSRYRAQSPLEVAVKTRGGTHIGVLPGPGHRQKIVGVMGQEALLPVADNVVLKGAKALLQIGMLTEVGLRDPPP